MSINIHPNQHAMAKHLNIDVSEMASEEAVINAIESLLGSESMEVRARWFAVSVLRHLRKAKWADLADCDLDEQSQQVLALQCLAVDGFATSLRTVTKDHRSKFRIVNFASSKNVSRGILATGTKAYKLAAQLMAEQGLLEQAPSPANKQPRGKAAAKAAPEPANASAPKPVAKPRVQSRPESQSQSAGKTSAPQTQTQTQTQTPKERRDDGSDELSNIAAAASRISEANSDLAMSDEEFARLDAELNKSDAEIVQQNWGDQPGEERWSRILGILAGVGFLVFVALLFL